MPFLAHHAINIAPTCPNIAWLRPNMAPAWPHNRVFIEALKFRLKWAPRLWGPQKPNNIIASLPASNWLIISFASISFTMSLNHLAEGLSDRGPAALLDCSACCLCKDGGPFHPIHLFRCCLWSHTNPLQGHHGKGCYNGAGLAQIGYLWLLYISVAFQTDGNFGNPESIWINLNHVKFKAGSCILTLVMRREPRCRPSFARWLKGSFATVGPRGILGSPKNNLLRQRIFHVGEETLAYQKAGKKCAQVASSRKRWYNSWPKSSSSEKEKYKSSSFKKRMQSSRFKQIDTKVQRCRKAGTKM